MPFIELYNHYYPAKRLYYYDTTFVQHDNELLSL